jgi:endonuclease/exonuclease/phosphatase (EEP) superfamily protein YafD
MMSNRPVNPPVSPLQTNATAQSDGPSNDLPKSRIWGRVARVGLQWSVFALMGQAACVVLGNYSPLLELGVHFSAHAWVGNFLAACLLFLLRAPRTATIATLLFASLTPLVQPWNWIPTSNAAPKAAADEDGTVAATPSERSKLKVLCWNVLVVNNEIDAIEALVEREDPDIIAFIEVRPGFLEAIEKTAAEYPIVKNLPYWGGEGIAVLSRVPGTQYELLDLGFERMPTVLARVPGPTHDLQLVALHTLSPIPPFRARIRDSQLSSLLEWSSNQQGPICVCGDFNTTPWTRGFKSLIRGGFVDSRVGVGNLPSWPAALGPLGLPIDHAITKGECAISNRQVLASGPGSDHRPIVFQVEY